MMIRRVAGVILREHPNGDLRLAAVQRDANRAAAGAAKQDDVARFRADVDEIATRDRFVRYTYPFNLLGWPALALPCGPAEGGLPASIQVVGRPGADGLVLAVGRAIESALRLA